MEQIIETLSRELNVRQEHAKAVVDLLDEGRCDLGKSHERLALV